LQLQLDKFLVHEITSVFCRWGTVYCGCPKDFTKSSGVCTSGSKTAWQPCQPVICCSIETRLYQPHFRGTKINRQYYQEVLLTQELLSVICSIAECVFSFSKRMHQHVVVDVLCYEAPHYVVICSQPTLLTYIQLITMSCIVAGLKLQLLCSIITGCYQSHILLHYLYL